MSARHMAYLRWDTKDKIIPINMARSKRGQTSQVSSTPPYLHNNKATLGWPFVVHRKTTFQSSPL